MKLWIVVTGERNRGYSISDVFTTEAAADDRVDLLTRQGDWIFGGSEIPPFGNPVKTWIWHTEIDYIEMQEWEV